MRFIYLIIYLLAFSGFANAKHCFQYYYSNKIFDALMTESSITESLLLKSAMKDVLGQQSLGDASQRWLLGIVEGINYNNTFKEQIMIEVRRREFKRLSSSLGLPTNRDLRFVLHQNKHLLSQFISLAINSSVNLLSFKFLGSAGYLVHIPKFKVFDPREIPDEVLSELIENPDPGYHTNKFLKYKIKFVTQTVLNNIRKFFNVGIVVTALLFNYNILTNPNKFLDNQINLTLHAVNSLTVSKNLETIKSLETKLEHFKLQNDQEKIIAAEELIQSIKLENKALITHSD